MVGFNKKIQQKYLKLVLIIKMVPWTNIALIICKKTVTILIVCNMFESLIKRERIRNRYRNLTYTLN